jgi:hypothetical protein
VDRIERQPRAAPVLGRVATEHVWVGRCRGGAQAATDFAARGSGSPMTRFAGPWSQP